MYSMDTLTVQSDEFMSCTYTLTVTRKIARDDRRSDEEIGYGTKGTRRVGTMRYLKVRYLKVSVQATYYESSKAM